MSNRAAGAGGVRTCCNDRGSNSPPLFNQLTSSRLSAGRTKPLSTIPDDHKGYNSTAELMMHPSGQFLYGSNRGHNSLVIYSIDQKSGELSTVGWQSSGGKIPRGFGISPDGKFVVSANQRDNKVVVLRVNPATGELSDTGHGIEVPTPICVIFD